MKPDAFLQAATDTELAGVFQKAGIPDFTEAVTAVGKLVSVSPPV